MNWLIILILGGLGSGWPRDPDDYWPRWCIACQLIIGAISALVVNYLAARDIGTGFFPMAIVSFASGYVGSRLVGGLLNMNKTAATR